MAKAKKAVKKAVKKSTKKRKRNQQVRLLEAEILASRMRDFTGEADGLLDGYGAYGAYGEYGVYGGYGAYGAYGFGAYGQGESSLVSIQIRPNGKIIVEAPPQRRSAITVQIWSGGRISVQEHAPVQKRRKAGVGERKKKTKKASKKAAKKGAKKTAKKRTKKTGRKK